MLESASGKEHRTKDSFYGGSGRFSFAPGRDGQVGSPGLPEVGDLRAAVFRDTSLFCILTPSNRKLSGLISLAEPEYHYFAGRWD